MVPGARGKHTRAEHKQTTNEIIYDINPSKLYLKNGTYIEELGDFYLCKKSLSTRPIGCGRARPPTVQAWVYYAVLLINSFIFFSN